MGGVWGSPPGKIKNRIEKSRYKKKLKIKRIERERQKSRKRKDGESDEPNEKDDEELWRGNNKESV